MPLKISRILHAGYVFECGKTQIAFDPIFENPFSVNCHAFPNVRFDKGQIRKLRFSAVFISHFHDDHCSLESLNLLDRTTLIYIYCNYEEIFSLLKELGFRNVIPLSIDAPIRVGDFEIIPRKALDADVDSIFHIKAEGLNVLNIVDSWIDPSTLDLFSRTSWDLVLWPFQTMREIEVIAPSRAERATGEIPEEWISELQTLNPKYIVPSSCQFIQEPWSWYRSAFFPISYRGFAGQIGQALPRSRVVRMNPSTSFILSQNSLEPASPLPWVLPVGDQDLDYEYDPDVKPTSTSEIAKHLAPLTKEQKERVANFCKSEILEKYQLLDSSEDPYFSKPRIWKLSIYNENGLENVFFYQLKNSKIELVPEFTGKPDWTTEIPMAKLYAALEFGETLTSLYLRVNDAAFEEIVDDPLIRCLFNGVFGAYQKAQLKKLKSL